MNDRGGVVVSANARLPDFIVLGAMKAGTTSLFRWLETHPNVALPQVKEPGFFSDDAAWARGLEEYSELFMMAPSGFVTGEASVAYSDPAVSRTVAHRIAATLPDARLLFLTRDPVARLRSHYVHQVKRGRERRTLLEAIVDRKSDYQLRSRYLTCLEPFLEGSRDRLLIVPMEAVFSESHQGWEKVQRFLGLDPIPAVGIAANVSAEKPQFGSLMSFMWDRGVRVPPEGTPLVLRRWAKKLLLRPADERSSLLASASVEVPADIREALESETAALYSLVGDVRGASTA
jgi:hypothetical protein